jgi:hypothetical protein
VKLIKVDLNKYFISLLNFEESQLEWQDTRVSLYNLGVKR